MAKKLVIYGLDDFHLTATALSRLGERRVQLSIQLAGQTVARLLHLPPKQRDEALREALSRQLRALQRRFPSIDFIPRDKKKASWTLDAVVSAKEVVSVATMSQVAHVTLDSVQRRRKKRMKRSPGWFCVWGVFAVQIEDQVAGFLELEDRLVLMKAISADDARRRMERRCIGSTPYMNQEGYLVRWQLTSIRDIYELFDQAIDPRGTEVYSKLRTTRMRPEYRWHPRKEENRTTRVVK